MFAPVEMSELDIFVPEGDIDAVAEAVARVGVVHLQDPGSLGRWGEGVGTEWLGRVSTYAAQERRTEELLDRMGIECLARPWEGRLDPADDLVAIEEELQEIEEEVHALAEREAELKREIRHWELVAKSLSSLAPLSVSISDLRQLELLHLIAGTIPTENLARLEASLFRIPYAIIPVHRYDGHALVFGFCAHEDAPILERALESAFLEPLALPDELGGTPREALAEAYERLEGTQTELALLQEQCQERFQHLGPRLQSMLTRVRRDHALADARARFGRTGEAYLIAGWAPKERVAELQSAVVEASEGRATVEERPARGMDGKARVPTLLKNSKLFTPLEALVTTYGTPGYREIDPTPILGITFVLMFGSMFGDLGHGLVLVALGALVALRVIPQLASLAQMGTVLIACGLSSALFGLLYGSVFGMEELIPSILSPMHDMLILLGAAVGLGVLVLNIGFLCRLASAVRSGTILEAIFDRNGIVGLLLYWCLLALLVLPMVAGSLPGWVAGALGMLTLALLFAEPLTNLVTGRRPLVHGGLGMFLVQSFFELFETFIGYASNTLSFVRLGAFAVAHAGLSMVVFILADMVVGSGAAGSVLRVLIIVGGNIVVIGFEGLIVAIQTMRLEYYELFGKFFAGEGTPFKPLTLYTV